MVLLFIDLLKCPLKWVKKILQLIKVVMYNKSVQLHISNVVENCTFGTNIYLGEFSVLRKSFIDNNSYIGDNCSLTSVKVGKFCSIANDVIIGLGGVHPTSFVTSSPVLYRKKFHIKTLSNFTLFNDSYSETNIGNDVWIGRSVLIKEGVTIGHGAIIAAGAVVVKDVAPYEIVAGVPAVCIRNRFNDIVIQDLLKLQWWDFDENMLSSLSQYVDSPTIFIEKANDLCNNRH